MMTVRVRYLTKAGESGRRKKVSSFGNIGWSAIGVVARQIVGECLVGVQKVLDDDLPIRRRGLRTFPVATPEGALTRDADSGCEGFIVGNHTFVGANVLSDNISDHAINAIIFPDLIGSHVFISVNVLVVIVLVILIVVVVVDITATEAFGQLTKIVTTNIVLTSVS
jgi:hypothetical protein